MNVAVVQSLSHVQDTCVRVTEPLCSTCETNAALLINDASKLSHFGHVLLYVNAMD